MQSFGERLAQERREKAARERRDISQKDVAEAVGSSAPSVSRWENGGQPPGDAILERLARYFGVTMGWLRYGQEPRTYEPAAVPPVLPSIAAGPISSRRAKEIAEQAEAKRAKPAVKRSNRRA